MTNLKTTNQGFLLQWEIRPPKLFNGDEHFLEDVGNEPAVITTREELKENAGREEFKNLITQGWRRTEKDWTKKESEGCKS